MDTDSEIRRRLLQELLTELYTLNPSDAIATKEWLERKLNEPATQPRYTNHYFCRRDGTRWNSGWSCKVSDCCPNCGAVVEPFAATRNETGVLIPNRASEDEE